MMTRFKEAARIGFLMAAGTALGLTAMPIIFTALFHHDPVGMVVFFAGDEIFWGTLLLGSVGMGYFGFVVALATWKPGLRSRTRTSTSSPQAQSQHAAEATLQPPRPL